MAENGLSLRNRPVKHGVHIASFFFFLFFFHPIYYLRPSILSLLVVPQIRGHIAGSFRPLPTTVRAQHYYRENISSLSSLVDWRRIVLTHARRSQRLILFLSFFANKFQISPPRDSNSRTNTTVLIVAFEGYH